MYKNRFGVPTPSGDGLLTLADRIWLCTKGFFLNNDVPEFVNIFGYILDSNYSTSTPITIKLNRTHSNNDINIVIDNTYTAYPENNGYWELNNKLTSTDDMNRDSYYTITIDDLILKKKLPLSNTAQNILSLPDYAEAF